jgi:hypothetical protein
MPKNGTGATMLPIAAAFVWLINKAKLIYEPYLKFLNKKLRQPIK